ncbi:hypothetical protein MKZ38_001132 [Zalerion maritima]|uniref:Uncharacterized protein n=1 Tax=Zalerion maritima TaxID=339359 RepID=A0AAD5WRN3_9PEZI|nr:hypothetical protein MKZ38_001132 [Zalerion maritima]
MTMDASSSNPQPQPPRKNGGNEALASGNTLSLPPDMNPFANVPPCPFPNPTRQVTTHNSGSGSSGGNKREAVFSDAMPAAVEKHESSPGFVFWNLWTTPTCAHPATATEDGQDSFVSHPMSESIAKNEDIAHYQSNYPAMRTLDNPHGSTFRILDFMPGAVAPMHRTQTLDYGFVMEGEVEAIMDSGEVRAMSKGSVIVQRGTMHGWREATGEKWARVGFVLLGFGGRGLELPEVETIGAAKELEQGEMDGDTPEWQKRYIARNEGKELKEWVPWMQGVPPMIMAGEVIETSERARMKEASKQKKDAAGNQDGNPVSGKL